MDTQKDFFISYSSKDVLWAEWIGWQLEEAGYSTIIQKWDFGPNPNFIDKMNDAIEGTKQVLFVLSKHSLESEYAKAELNATLAKDPNNKKGELVLVRIDNCTPPGLLRGIAYIDINSLKEDQTRNNLLDGINWKGRIKPEMAPDFPGAYHESSLRENPPFPGDKIKSCPHDIVIDYRRKIHGLPIVNEGTWGINYPFQSADMQNVLWCKAQKVLDGYENKAAWKTETISMKEFLEIIQGKMTGAIVLLGEGGVGKSVTCRYLRNELSNDDDFDPIPIYIPLGEWSNNDSLSVFLASVIGNCGWDDFRQAADGHRLVAFLDGLNEIPPNKYKEVVAFVHDCVENNKALIVATSRPVVVLNDDAWKRSDVSFYEIRRWTDDQLKQYLKLNKCDEVWEHLEKAHNQVRFAFSLPLHCALLIRQASRRSLPSLGSLADVFDQVIRDSIDEINTKGSHLSSHTHWNPKKIEDFLCLLAHKMTNSKSLRVNVTTLDSIGHFSERMKLLPLLRDLINTGLLRSGTIAGIDAEVSLEIINDLDVSFPHQAFQEYLTAQYVTKNPTETLPIDDLSHDAFWREVPVYMIQSMNDSREQEKFVKCFQAKGDFLTAIRLSLEITTRGLVKELKKSIIDSLVSNLGNDGLYHYTIESFAHLGEQGLEALRVMVDVPEARSVFAQAEANLIGCKREDANDPLWRTIARSIYILGELDDIWLAEFVEKHAHDIQSIHLLCHMGEALLHLSRSRLSGDDKTKEHFKAACRALEHSPNTDPVVNGYARCALEVVSGNRENQEKSAESLKAFLENQIALQGIDFQDGFWRRAHGIEIYAELSSTENFLKLAKELFRKEIPKNYEDYAIPGYRLVQSSVMKAILRSCQQFQSCDNGHNFLLELVFESEGAANNQWLCQMMERLLLIWFTSSKKNIQWLKDWVKDETLGGDGIRDVLRNVLYLIGSDDALPPLNGHVNQTLLSEDEGNEAVECLKNDSATTCLIKRPAPQKKPGQSESLLPELPKKDESLIRASARKRFPSYSEIRLDPTARLGLSGHRVYCVRAITNRHNTRWWYAKVGQQEKLSDEFNRYENFVDGILPRVPEAWFYQIENDGDACLAYFSVGELSEDLKPLSELLKYPSSVAIELLRNAICDLFTKVFSPWKQQADPVEIHWFIEYQKYLRWDETNLFAKNLFRSKELNDSAIDVGRRRLVSPLKMVQRISDEQWASNVLRRIVHGDLHQRNIIAEDQIKWWLIDFSWTGIFHGLVDYALLEASLKIFFFADSIGEDRYLDLHDHLNDNITSPLADLSEFEKNFVDIVSTIRECAKLEIDSETGHWPDEYYTSSLLVTMGLLSIRESKPRYVWITSAWLATHINSDKFLV